MRTANSAMASRTTCQKVLFVAGTMLMLLPNGVMVYWGSMSAYVLSYAVWRGNYAAHTLDSPWTVSLYVMFITIGAITYVMASNSIGKHKTLLASIVIMDLGILATYFSIQHSLIALYVSFGIMLGFGTGIVYGHIIQLGLQLANGNEGIFMAAIQSAFPFSGIVMGQLMTWYANPSNELPTFVFRKSKYFTQPAILARVPSMFLLLGGIAVFSHSVGMIIVEGMVWKLKQLNVVEEKVRLFEIENGGTTGHLAESLEDAKDNTGDDTTNCAPTTKNYQIDDKEKTGNRITLKCMMKRVEFYAMWWIFFCIETLMIISHNYFKLFGQIYIRDDHFLSYLGTTMILLSFTFRFTFGVLIDRFGPRLCLQGLMVVSSLASSWIYFTAIQGGKWLYFIMAASYGGLGGASLSCYLNVAAVVFGKDNFSAKYGLMRSSSVVLNPVAPLLIESLLQHLGWYFTFGWSAALNVTCLLLASYVIPDHQVGS